MNYSPFVAFDLISSLVAVLVVAASVLFVVLLVRLMLAATRALNAIALDRTVRLDLLLADGDGPDAHRPDAHRPDADRPDADGPEGSTPA